VNSSGPSFEGARARIVIVGGGIVGASVAFHLAEAGVDGVVLVERDLLGAGSTSKGAGGVRHQFSDPVNVQLAQRSIAAYADLERRTGRCAELRQPGYLFLLDCETDMDAFARATAYQRGLGIPTVMLTPNEAQQLAPPISTDGLCGASFCPWDGYASPEAAVAAYAGAARRLGVEVRQHCQVDAVLSRAGRITGVATSSGALAADTVILATGAWSAALAATAGLRLPVTPVRRQVAITGPVDPALRDLPMTIDFASGFYFHPDGPGLLMGVPGSDTVGFDISTTPALYDDLARQIARRAPSLLGLGVRRTWAGLYERTPDHNGLIGQSEDVSGLLYATGFSGHGFMLAPAVGEVVRDLYLNIEPDVDVAGLSASRFTRGIARPEAHVV
jgi:sarcosine oxidase subunit beta